MVDKNMNISEAKKRQLKAKIEEEMAITDEKRPGSDLYADIHSKDPETGVEVPTEESVVEAKTWVDEETRM